MNQRAPAFWSISGTEILQHLGTTKEGLSGDEARRRLARYGSNLLKPQERSDVLTLLLAQFKSPLILILFFLQPDCLFLRDPVDAFIIITIVLVSRLLGFWQEHSAINTMDCDVVGGAVDGDFALYAIELALWFHPMPPEFLLVLVGILFL